MKTWAILPVKPLVRAKSRLAPVLTPEQREKLAMGMLMHTIRLLKTIDSIANILVISRDTKVLAEARDADVYTIQESGQPELNPALQRATRLLKSWGAKSVLVLPTDIPLINREDIEAIIHLGRFSGTLVLAPDSVKDGTNALYSNPAGMINYSYGEGSFERHRQAAELAGVNIEIYASERISLDLDTPADLEHYFSLAQKYNMPTIDFPSGAIALAEDN